MAKVLLVEDNEAYAGIIVSWLEAQNYTVDHATTGEDALQILLNFNYDLLILDWELPGIAGIKVCEQYRAKGGRSPILFLTARVDAESKVSGLDTGADDYLCKPFEWTEFGARVRALLRRPSGLVPNKLSAPGLTLELETRSAIVGEQPVALTQRECALLEFLLRHPNQPFSSKELLDSVWPLESAFSEDTVRSCIRVLRKKLHLNGHEIIKTSNWSGYRIDNPGLGA